MGTVQKSEAEIYRLETQEVVLNEKAKTAEANATVSQKNADSALAAAATAQILFESREKELKALSLIQAAYSNLNQDPELSILLPLQSLSLTYTTEAEDVLHDAVRLSRVRVSLPHSPALTSVAFSPEEKILFTAGEDGKVVIWDVNHDRRNYLKAFQAHEDAIYRIEFSPTVDSQSLVTVSKDGTAKIWDITDITDFSLRIPPLADHQGIVLDAAFSPTGERLVTASSDKTAKIWNTETGEVLLTLNGHSVAVVTVDFSSDGNYVATGSLDKTIKIVSTPK